MQIGQEMMRHTFIGLLIAAVLVGCRAAIAPSESAARPKRPHFKAQTVQAQQFGKASIAVGMTKKEVLVQIELSRKQYEPLQSETDSDLYVAQPSEDTIGTDAWLLTCPSRNSHILGGGGGIILRLTFKNGRITSVQRLPWVGA